MDSQSLPDRIFLLYIKQLLNKHGAPCSLRKIIRYAADFLSSHLKLEPIGSYKFDKEARTAWFDTCEKHGPELTRQISKAFPEVTAYGTDQWDDTSYIEAYSSGGIDTPLASVADFELDECSEDGTGSLRIDVAVIDKATGSKVTIGDLIYCNDWEDVENIEGDDSYSFLTSLVGYDNRIEEAVEDCKKYFANNMV